MMPAQNTMHSHPHSHSHAHGHAHGHNGLAPPPPPALQPATVNGLAREHSHAHSHSHSNAHSHSGSCGHDHGHSHSHSHSHDHGLSHSHDHGHDHGHTHGAGGSCSHGHGHSHDGHDHHDHDHHHHDHGPPPNYAFSVPYVKLFTDSAAQFPAKALWLGLGSALTLGIFFAARSSSSMSLQSYSLLFLFDLLAIVNEFVSHALSRGLIAPRDPSQYSFGLQRLEVVFAFANALSLFFSGMYALKEALEVMLEEEHHKHDSTGSYNAVIPIAAAVIGTLAIIRLSTHKPYYKFITRSRFSEWTTNPFIQSHGLVATILLLVHWTQSIYAASPARTQTHVAPAADALGACAIGLVLMWLATPLAIAMGQILLQVTPAPLVSALQRACGEISSMEGVMQVLKAQYWSNAFNEQVGVIHVQHRSGADPSVVREHVRERLMARVPGDWWIQVEVGQSRII